MPDLDPLLSSLVAWGPPLALAASTIAASRARRSTSGAQAAFSAQGVPLLGQCDSGSAVLSLGVPSITMLGARAASP